MKVALIKGQEAHPLASVLYWHVVDRTFRLKNDRGLHYTTCLVHFHDTRKVFIIGDDVMLADGLLRSEANQNSSSFGCKITVETGIIFL
jgi:hypothetical protein